MKAITLNYDPRCEVYKREQTKGKPVWWIKYYLPNGVRMRRPCDKTQRAARQKMNIKHNQLLQGIFDEKDLKKLKDSPYVPVEQKRLSIDEALALYLELSATRKNIRTNYNDYYTTVRQFEFFQKIGRIYMDEIEPIDVQLMVNSLNQRGLAEATMHDYVAAVSKCFNWLIGMKQLDCSNPVTKTVSVPKKGGKARNRVPTDAEVLALITASRELKATYVYNSPIHEILLFLIFTGARLGEVLHAEWDDFDFENGVWYIRRKRECPTRYGLGWEPKRGKERDVPLFPEALGVLHQMPHLDTIGKVPIRDEAGKITGHEVYSNRFVFPKQVVRIVKKQRHVSYERVDSVKSAWGTVCKKAGVSDLRLHDLRRYFNTFLKNHCLFSAKEAGAYVGNTEEVNDRHYTTVDPQLLQLKIRRISLTETLGLSEENEEGKSVILN